MAFLDPLFPYNKTRFKEQAIELITTTVPEFIGEADMGNWLKATKNKRFYGAFHHERLIGFLFQTQADDGHGTPLILAYGVAAEHQGKGVGSAMTNQLLQDLSDQPHILADVNRNHPQSLVCLHNAAARHGRNMTALGRLDETNNNALALNQPPVGDECMEWCLQLKGAPDLYPGRLPRAQWPPTANEADMWWTSVPDDEIEEDEDEEESEEDKDEGEDEDEEESDEEGGEVAQQPAKRGRGRPKRVSRGPKPKKQAKKKGGGKSTKKQGGRKGQLKKG